MAIFHRPKRSDRATLVVRSSDLPDCPTCGEHQIFVPTDQTFELGSLLALTVTGPSDAVVFDRVVRVVGRRTASGAGKLGAGIVVDVEPGIASSSGGHRPLKEHAAA